MSVSLGLQVQAGHSITVHSSNLLSIRVGRGERARFSIARLFCHRRRLSRLDQSHDRSSERKFQTDRIFCCVNILVLTDLVPPAGPPFCCHQGTCVFQGPLELYRQGHKFLAGSPMSGRSRGRNQIKSGSRCSELGDGLTIYTCKKIVMEAETRDNHQTVTAERQTR